MNTQELTSLITRLEEEYGKTAQGSWELDVDAENSITSIVIHGKPNEFGVLLGGLSSYEDNVFITSAHNSMPTLLAALKYYMAVAEAEKKIAEYACQLANISVDDIKDIFKVTSQERQVFERLVGMTNVYEMVYGKPLTDYKAIDTPSN